MINVVKIISSSIENGRRILKFLRLGRNDVQTSYESLPFGVDSVPIKDLKAIYAPTGVKGESVIIGYINTKQIAQVGEYRTFSTDENGNDSFYVHLKNDGTAEIGGDSDNLVRFQALEDGFNQLKDDFNTFLLHTHPSSGAPPAPPQTPSTASISGAKIDELKTL